MNDVRKISGALSVSQAIIHAARDDAVRQWFNGTPEERAERLKRLADVRAGERANAEHVELTLDALLDKLGFSREYAEHLVQPYCDCGDTYDGWQSCPHVADLRIEMS